MSLVPDYSSSSDEEQAPAAGVARSTAFASVSSSAGAAARPNSPSVAISAGSNAQELAEKPAKAKKKTKKSRKPRSKALVYLPPEIQRLLESGATGGGDSSDDSDGGSELLAKRKLARRRAQSAGTKRPRAAAAGEEQRSEALAFLPPPKFEEEEKEEAEEEAQVEQPSASGDAQEVQTEQQQQEAYAQYYAQQQAAYDYGLAAYALTGYEEPAVSSSKRARHRDRELERALQQGQFHQVLGKITEVTGPSPNAWQAPAETLEGNGDKETKVQASFWSTQQGARVTSAKPSRLQRQKHQLNQLAFDAKSREFELLDRKGAALKTKSETYAKYGW